MGVDPLKEGGGRSGTGGGAGRRAAVPSTPVRRGRREPLLKTGGAKPAPRQRPRVARVDGSTGRPSYSAEEAVRDSRAARVVDGPSPPSVAHGNAPTWGRENLNCREAQGRQDRSPSPGPPTGVWSTDRRKRRGRGRRTIRPGASD